MTLPRNVTSRTLLILSGTALLVYWVALFVMTHLPPEVLSRFLFSFSPATDEYLHEGGDKPIHLLAYAGLAFQLTLWLWIRGVDDQRLWKITAVTLVGYALVDELLQIPFHRSADIGDVLADWAGAALGAVCFLAVRLLISRLGLRPRTAPAEAP